MQAPGLETQTGREDAGRYGHLFRAGFVRRALYVSEELFRQEMADLFGQTWIYHGHESEIPAADDFITRRIGRRPVIVTRNDRGEINVLLNRCTHRGAIVCRQSRGNARRFTCGYHAWSFANDGRCTGIPLRHAYGPGFEIEDQNLHRPARVECYRGFIFACMKPDIDDLASHLGGARMFLDQWLDRDGGRPVVVNAGSMPFRTFTNWKTVYDNAGDGYHPPFSHTSMLRVFAKRHGADSDMWVSGWTARDILSPFPLPGNDLATRGDVTAAPLAAAHDNLNWERLRGVRVSALIQLTDALTILPSYMEQRITQGGQNLIDRPPGDVEAHYQPFDLAEPVLDSFNLYSLNMRYAFRPFDLTSQTSRWTHNLRQTQDGSEVLQSVLDLPGYDLADGGIGTSPWVETDYSRQLSKELRVTSTYPSPLRWQFGAFYSDFSSTNYQTGRAPGGAALFGITNLYSQNIVQPIQQVAGFGQAPYRLLPSLTFTAGLRYCDFMSSNDATQSGLFGSNGDDIARHTRTGRLDTGLNPKFTLAWLPNPDLTVYSTISRGFRPGGGNEVVPTTGPDSCSAALASLGKTSAPLTFGADHVWNYELGEKARLLGGRVTINAAGYYEDWADVQKFISLSCG